MSDINPNNPPPQGFGSSFLEWVRSNILYIKRRLNALNNNVGGKVDSISGTTDRIDITGTAVDPVVNISENYIIASDHVSTPTLGTATFNTVAEFLDVFTSAGRITGGDLSVNVGDPTKYDISALNGIIAPINSDLGPVLFFDMSGTTGNPTILNTVIYIGVDYNSGNPIFVTKLADVWNFNTEFPLGAVINLNGAIAVYNNPWWISDGISHITERFQSEGKVRDNRMGGLILGESGTRNITVSSGQILDLLNKHPISALDTAVSGHFITTYYDGIAWQFSTAVQWPNTQYNNIATGLATVTPNEYANLWFYATVFDRIVMLYGQDKFTIAADASTQAVPTFLPPELDKFGILIGRIMFQGTNPLLRTLNSASDGAFISPVTNAHNNLSGLQGGTTLQYYHLTADEYNNRGTVTNVSFVNTSGFTGTVTSGSTTPVIRVGTSISGILKGNGSVVSAAIPGTDYGIVSSVAGTSARIVVTSGSTTPVIDISSGYTGQTSITTLGTVTSGTWNATPVDLATYVSGNLSTSHLNSGSGATSTTFWRGDGVWATPIDVTGNPGTVTLVSGTSNRIDVVSGTTTPVINISPLYIGQTSINTLGTISTGTWNAVPIDLSLYVSGNLAVSHLNSGTNANSQTYWRGDGTWTTALSNFSFTNTSGFTGVVTSGTTTPVLRVGTSVSGIVKGDGFSITSATPGTDYGTVSNVSFTNTSGFTGTVTSGTTTPVIRVGTSVTGIMKGDGTSASAAIDCTDYVSPSGSCILSNKRYVKRVLTMAPGSSCTPSGDTGDICIQANVQTSGSTLTVNTPTGTPFDGQDLILRFTSTGQIVFSWNSTYVGCTTTQLPLYSSGQNKTDIFYFRWNAATSKWQIINSEYGF